MSWTDFKPYIEDLMKKKTPDLTFMAKIGKYQVYGLNVPKNNIKFVVTHNEMLANRPYNHYYECPTMGEVPIPDFWCEDLNTAQEICDKLDLCDKLTAILKV